MCNTMPGCPGEDLLGLVLDIATKARNGTITPIQLKRFGRGENPFEVPMDTASQLERWCSLLTSEFGITIDPASIKIPERRPGFERLIVIPEGLTLNQIVTALRKKFDVSLYVEDLDADVTENDRTSGTTYAVWVRDNVEADEELKSLSADDLTAQKIAGLTLMERLLLELVYFSEAGKHLDVQNVTLCNGSRHSDGGVPYVDWYADGRRLCVYWSSPGDRDGSIRARAVVS